MPFDAGSIVSTLKLERGNWDAAIASIKKDQNDLSRTVSSSGKSVKGFGDLLSTYGVRHAKEASARVTTLKTDLGRLNEAYKQGVINLGGYQKATGAINNELKGLEGTQKETAAAGSAQQMIFGTLFKSFVSGAVVVMGLHKAYQFLKQSMVDGIQAAIREEQSEMRLATALETTGRSRAKMLPSLMSFAKEQMRATIYTHQEVEASATLLAQLTDLDEKGIKRALRGAMGLRAVLGPDEGGLTSTTMMLIKATEGQMVALKRAGITIDETVPKGLLFNEVLNETEKLYGRVTAETKTFGGSLKQLGNWWREVKEKAGTALINSEDVRKSLEGLKAITEYMATHSVWDRIFGDLVKYTPILKGLSDSIKMLGLITKLNMAEEAKATKQISEFAESFVSDLRPKIEETIDPMKKWNDLIKEFGILNVKSATRNLTYLTEAQKAFGEMLKAKIIDANQYRLVMEKLTKQVEELTGKYEVETRLQLEKKLAEYRRQYVELAKQHQLTGKSAEELAKKIRDIVNELENNISVISRLGLITKTMAQRSLQDFKKDYDDLSKALKAERIDQDEFDKGIKLLNEEAIKAGQGVMVFSDGVKQLGVDFDSVLPPARNLTDALKTLKLVASSGDFFAPMVYESAYFSVSLNAAREKAALLGISIKQDLITNLNNLIAAYDLLKAKGYLTKEEEISAVNTLIAAYKKASVEVPLALKIMAIESKDFSDYFVGLMNDIATSFGNAFEELFSGMSKQDKKRKEELQAELDELDKSFRRGQIRLSEYQKKYKDIYDEMKDITGGFAKFFTNIWNSIKAAFFRILGEMVTGWIIKFVQKIMAGADLLTALFSGGGIGKLASLGFGALGVGAAAGGGAATIGGTIGTFGTAGGAVLIPQAAGAGGGALAGATVGLVGAVAFAGTWLFKLGQALGIFHKKVDPLVKYFDDMTRAARAAGVAITEMVKASTIKAPSIKSPTAGLPTRNVGTFHLKTDVIDVSDYLTYGSYANIPLEEKETDEGGGGKQKRRKTQSTEITINVNMNGTMITDRDFTRKHLIPEFFSALSSNEGKSKIQRVLGVA